MYKEYIEEYTNDGTPTGKKFLKSEIHKKGITDHHRKSFEPIKSLIHT